MTTTTPTTPETKWQSRVRNDQRGSSRYAARPAIGRWHEERRLERELGRAIG